jgi:hypothetical protein
LVVLRPIFEGLMGQLLIMLSLRVATVPLTLHFPLALSPSVATCSDFQELNPDSWRGIAVLPDWIKAITLHHTGLLLMTESRSHIGLCH